MCLFWIMLHICAGISTEQIDLWVYEQTTHRGGIPAPLNYEGFPKSVCTSVNDQVCHGIPSADVILKDGDIINVDVSTIYKGYYSDSSRMFCIGEVSPEKKRLVEITKQAIEEGLKQVRPWGHLGDMGQAINDYATANGYTVVREIGGHGVGLEFHEDPWVSFVSKKGTEMLMVPGMIFTIEPMINMGKADIFVDAENDWTIYTDDGGIRGWRRRLECIHEGWKSIRPVGDPGSDHRGWIRDPFLVTGSGSQICLLQVWLPFCKRYIRNIQKLIFYI